MEPQLERKTRPDDRGEIEQLLDRVARALTAADARAIAQLWETPAFVIGAEGAQALASRDWIGTFLAAAKEQYARHGIVSTRPEIERIEWIGDRVAVVDVRWPYLDESGNERGAERAAYTLVRDARGELKIRVALSRVSTLDAHEH